MKKQNQKIETGTVSFSELNLVSERDTPKAEHHDTTSSGTESRSLAGYALTGQTTEHKFFFLHGGGRNGKGVFVNTLNDIWGAYSRNAVSNLFLASNRQQHPTGLASLQGARLVIGSEIPKGETWNDALLKDLTGGDTISARFMHGNSFDFYPQLTLMIAGNEMPSLAAVTPAIRARMILIPFNVEIPSDERDPDLKHKLMAEAPEILRWAIDGALDWQRNKLNVPDSILAASNTYLDEEDRIQNFLNDETVLDANAIVKTEDLYKRYTDWCTNQGVSRLIRKEFVREMKAHRWDQVRRQGGRVFEGLKLA